MGGGAEFTDVLFLFQLRLFLNQRGSCNPHHSPGEKDQSQVCQNHYQELWIHHRAEKLQIQSLRLLWL